VREHIPRTISLFPPHEAVAVLQRHLAAERVGSVRFKILRGLGRIASDHPRSRSTMRSSAELAARTAQAAIQVLRFPRRAPEGSRAASCPGPRPRTGCS
jgi:hypothetical protein